MSFDTLTTASINVMGMARAEAQAKGLTHVDVEHILLGLLAELSGIAYLVLKKNGLQLREARMQVAKQTKEEKLAARKNFALSDGAKKVLTTAEAIAAEHSKERVDTEHLLLAVLKEKNWRTRDIFDNFGIDIERLRADVESEIRRQSEGANFTAAEKTTLSGRIRDIKLDSSKQSVRSDVGSADVSQSSMRLSAPAFHDFTDSAIKVIAVAEEEARLLGHNFIGSEQLLLGLLPDAGIAGNQIRKLSISVYKARREVEKIIGRGSGFMGFEIPFTSHAKMILLDAKDQASELGIKMVGAEHLLLALLAHEDCVARCVLEHLDVDVQQLRGNVLNALIMPKE